MVNIGSAGLCRATVWLCACLFPAACTDNATLINTNDNGIKASIGLPASILAARAVNLNQVEVEVTADAESVPMSRGDGNTWSGTINLDQGRQYNITVRWKERIADELITLGFASELLSLTDGSPRRISFSNSQFDTAFDRDGDGYFNLAERQSDTNPLDNADPGTTPVYGSLQLRLDLPERLAETGSLDEQAIYATASVNGLGVALSRQGSQWSGTANGVAVDSRAFVIVNWFQDTTSNVRLARAQRTVFAGVSTVFSPASGDYNVNYDVDCDGITNLQEIINGTDPRNAGSR